MNSDDFDGTLVLEKLAEIDKKAAFFEAVDSDNFEEARRLIRVAGIDAATIQVVLGKMAEAAGEH
jgi:hypothetical protein